MHIYIVYAPHPIFHTGGIETICEYLETRSDKSISTNNLFDLESFILKSSYFENEELMYHQKGCFAIGTRIALPYSNLFMAGL